MIEKRLLLKEELRIHRNRKRERVEQAVRLKSMRAEVERIVPTASDADGRGPLPPSACSSARTIVA